ncbi:MAG: carboxypeptidase regulatory-like domain-containing protein, partial [Acidobacteriota bacterium]
MIAPVLALLIHAAFGTSTFAVAAGQAPPANGRVASTISGVVHDGSGGMVSGAVVIVRSTSGAQSQTTSGADGRFALTMSSAGDLTLIVRASGFGERRQSVDAGSADLDVQLVPATHFETVTVTPTRSEQLLGDVPASVNVLDRKQIRQSPAVVADDVLRQIPTFSLFRRTSSVATHPTTQGVSLRGIGPSGVSRTLV